MNPFSTAVGSARTILVGGVAFNCSTCMGAPTGTEHSSYFISSTIITTIASKVKMDPYSAEGELINIHNHFHQGQYQEVVDFDTSSLSSENELPARVLKLRAQIALGQAEDVVADVKGEKEPELIVIGALATYSVGKEDDAVKTIEKLAESNGDNAVVQVIGGTVLQAAGKSEEALALLSQHQGNRMSHCQVVDLNFRLPVPQLTPLR